MCFLDAGSAERLPVTDSRGSGAGWGLSWSVGHPSACGDLISLFQSICAAVAFFYSNYLLLPWQLLVMVIFGFCGTVSFFTVEWEAAAIVARGSDYRSI